MLFHSQSLKVRITKVLINPGSTDANRNKPQDHTITQDFQESLLLFCGSKSASHFVHDVTNTVPTTKRLKLQPYPLWAAVSAKQCRSVCLIEGDSVSGGDTAKTKSLSSVAWRNCLANIDLRCHNACHAMSLCRNAMFS